MLTQDSIIAVVGAGAMGAGIAQIAAQAGHAVTVLDQDEAALARGRRVVENGASALVKRGKLDAAQARALTDRIGWTLDIADLTGAGLVIEAIVENPDVKRALFVKLEDILGEDAVIATNTSSLSVTALASAFRRPQRFLGLHFFNPAPVMKLVEVISGAATDSAVAQGALALMKAWGKEAVAARDVPGFIVNRVARPFYGEGWRALEEGAADAATIDFLFRDLAGFRMGPLELGDFIGHDVNNAAARLIFDAYCGRTRFTPSSAQGALAAAGKFGRKSGEGVYDYRDGAEPPEPKFNDGPVASIREIKLSPDASHIAVLLTACGVAFSLSKSAPSRAAFVDGVVVRFSDGRPADFVAKRDQRPAAVLDYLHDPLTATSLAFAASDERARGVAVSFAAACGKKAVELSDRPGLVVFRALLQLANCAADAVRDGIAEREGIDRAMRFGVNYPFGPLEWAAAFGFRNVAAALDAIADQTGDEIYRAADVLRAGG